MKYWAYMNNEILGPFEKGKLLELPQFSNSTLICPQAPVGEKTEEWKEAATYPEIAAILSGGGDVKTGESSANNPAAAHSLKPISINDISKEPPPAEPELGGPKIEVNKLQGAAGKKPEPEPAQAEPQKKDPSQPHPVSSSSDKYDPISISEIGRKNPNLDVPAAKFSSNIDPLSLSQISRKQQDFSSPAPVSNLNEISGISKMPSEAAAVQHKDERPSIEIPAPRIEAPRQEQPPVDIPAGQLEIPASHEPAAAPAPAPAPAVSPAPAPAPAVSGAPAPAGDEIMRLIEKMASNSASKNDINDLKNYLDSKMDDVNRKIANISVSNIDGSIKNIDGRLSKIEDKLSRIEFGMPAAKAAQQAESKMEQPSGVFTLETPQQKIMEDSSKKQAAPAPAPEPDKPAEEKEKKKPVDMGKIFKPVLKGLLIIVLLAAVAGITVFALKQAGIVDLTGYITNYVPLPFLTSGQPAASDAVQEQAPGSEVSVSTQPVFQEAAPEPPKDLSEEVVYFSRTYALVPQGLSLENAITAIARKRKANVNGIAWQAKMGENQIYGVTCTVPMKKGKMEFTFETDYNAKTLRPLNAYGKAALDSLSVPVPAKKPAKARKPAPKPKKEAQKPAEDEEYVYEYVDEDEAGGQEEYVMPGVPKKE